MANRPTLERAIGLALTAHESQRDWCGRPFILHPLRVGMNLLNRYGDEGLCAMGILHDSVEDSNGKVTVGRIFREVGLEVSLVVQYLTHADDVPYEDYVTNLSQDRQATLVKLTDLADNLAPDRLMVANEKQMAVMVRHANALQKLREHAMAKGWL